MTSQKAIVPRHALGAGLHGRRGVRLHNARLRDTEQAAQDPPQAGALTEHGNQQ